MKTQRLSPGNYKITTVDGHVYFVQRFDSDYGDVQWMIDRDDLPTWGQTDTLAQAKTSIDKATRARERPGGAAEAREEAIA